MPDTGVKHQMSHHGGNRDLEGAEPDAAFLARLRHALAEVKNVSEFARRTGIERRMIHRYKDQGVEPSVSAVIRLARGLNVSLDALAMGHERPTSANSDETLGELVAVPRLNVRASAGTGLIHLGDEEQRSIAFQRAWLRTLGVQPGDAEFLEAAGDSMEPTIKDGDLMLLNRGYGRVIDGKIYVFVRDGLVSVKRLHTLALGGLMLISDNERYPTQTVPASEVASLQIEARVVWYGRAI